MVNHTKDLVEELVRDITKVGSIPKSEATRRIMELIKEAVTDEHQAWMTRRRCGLCGGKRDPDILSTMCSKCWEDA